MEENDQKSEKLFNSRVCEPNKVAATNAYAWSYAFASKMKLMRSVKKLWASRNKRMSKCDEARVKKSSKQMELNWIERNAKLTIKEKYFVCVCV